MKSWRRKAKENEEPTGSEALVDQEEAVTLVRKEDVDKAGRGREEPGVLLGYGSRFDGKVVFEGKAQVDGEFVGDIRSEGALVVGKKSVVEGSIAVDSATIFGQVSGTVTTRSTLELKADSRVTGDLNVNALIVERGAFFEGTVKMANKTAEPVGRSGLGAGVPIDPPGKSKK